MGLLHSSLKWDYRKIFEFYVQKTGDLDSEHLGFLVLAVSWLLRTTVSCTCTHTLILYHRTL
jgi:hypothetical protein